MEIDERDFKRFIGKINFSEYRRDKLIEKINSLLDEYEEENREQLFPQLESDIVLFCLDNGLDLNCFGKVKEVHYKDAEVLMILIQYKRFDVLYHLLDNYGYEKVVNDYRYEQDEFDMYEESYSVKFHESPLKMAIDSNDLELFINLVNYGAFSMSENLNVINYLSYKRKNSWIDELCNRCTIPDHFLCDLMLYSDIFIKYVKIKPEILTKKLDILGNDDMNLLMYAISKGYHTVLKFLYDQGIPLKPIKVENYYWNKDNFEKYIEDFEGYKEFVHVNENE